MVDNVPTSKTTGVFIGFVKLKGTAESADPVTSFLAETPCVYHEWRVEEQWTRMVTETYTDGNGKTQTRTCLETGWEQVASGDKSIPFYLQDDSGVILIEPAGAKIEPLTVFAQTCTPGDTLYYQKGPRYAVGGSDHRRRFTETAIPLKANLYVIGQAREREDIVAAEIAADKNVPIFLISTRSETQVSSSLKRISYGWAFGGLLPLFVFMLIRDLYQGLLPGAYLDIDQGIYAAAGFGYFVLGACLWVWMVYDSLVDVRQRVRAAWGLVDIQLKRRFDLIPNLVNCVTGSRDQEEQLQAELAGLQTQLEATPPGAAGPDHGAMSSQFIAMAERYPELTTDAAFIALQKNLSETEQRIALARSYFNEIATHYNTRLESVPERYVAALGLMKPQQLMDANGFERATVNVDLPARRPPRDDY